MWCRSIPLALRLRHYLAPQGTPDYHSYYFLQDIPSFFLSFSISFCLSFLLSIFLTFLLPFVLFFISNCRSIYGLLAFCSQRSGSFIVTAFCPPFATQFSMLMNAVEYFSFSCIYLLYLSLVSISCIYLLSGVALCSFSDLSLVSISCQGLPYVPSLAKKNLRKSTASDIMSTDWRYVSGIFLSSGFCFCVRV